MLSVRAPIDRKTLDLHLVTFPLLFSKLPGTIFLSGDRYFLGCLNKIFIENNHKKNSSGVRSGDSDGDSIQPRRSIHLLRLKIAELVQQNQIASHHAVSMLSDPKH